MLRALSSWIQVCAAGRVLAKELELSHESHDAPCDTKRHPRRCLTYPPPDGAVELDERTADADPALPQTLVIGRMVGVVGRVLQSVKDALVGPVFHYYLHEFLQRPVGVRVDPKQVRVIGLEDHVQQIPSALCEAAATRRA